MTELTREEIDSTPGLLVVEFGANWCLYCQAIQRYLADSLAKHPKVQHIQVEDGKGRRLGRSFQVKFWPTLIFMRDGEIQYKAVRPSRSEIDAGFQILAR